MALGRGMKLHNEYARALSNYERIPKAVLAAIAYSFADRLNCDIEGATPEGTIMDEWHLLYENGIVPQRPDGDKER